MLLKVWESIPNMWCQKAVTGDSDPVSPAHLESNPLAVFGLVDTNTQTI